MKLHFDANQDFQLQAIQAVLGLFEGQPLNKGDFEFSLGGDNGLGLKFSGVRNDLAISEEQVLKNLREVQKTNGLAASKKLEGLNFSVEMETGTGKTYVYLRTVYELNKRYGFKKFVIVVPSIAIKEGVLKNLEITSEHFQTIYDKTPVTYQVYSAERVSSLRSFADSNAIQILVINIDSFAKDENVINKPNDKLNGKKPVEFIQSARPIVIVDEPQNMETDIRKKAVANLNPAFTLRYSATHKNLYNLIYKLDPVQAYDLGLVKQIEVDSVFASNDRNRAFIQIEDFKAAKKFAEDCERNDNVEFFVKLPDWFTIQTPIGEYNPDWALIYKNESRIYFVAETKSTTDLNKLRPQEKMKIKCGAAHFKEFPEVKFKHVKEVSGLL